MLDKEESQLPCTGRKRVGSAGTLDEEHEQLMINYGPEKYLARFLDEPEGSLENISSEDLSCENEGTETGSIKVTVTTRKEDRPISSSSFQTLRRNDFVSNKNRQNSTQNRENAIQDKEESIDSIKSETLEFWRGYGKNIYFHPVKYISLSTTKPRHDHQEKSKLPSAKNVRSSARLRYQLDTRESLKIHNAQGSLRLATEDGTFHYRRTSGLKTGNGKRELQRKLERVGNFVCSPDQKRKIRKGFACRTEIPETLKASQNRTVKRKMVSGKKSISNEEAANTKPVIVKGGSLTECLPSTNSAGNSNSKLRNGQTRYSYEMIEEQLDFSSTEKSSNNNSAYRLPKLVSSEEILHKVGKISDQLKSNKSIDNTASIKLNCIQVSPFRKGRHERVDDTYSEKYKNCWVEDVERPLFTTPVFNDTDDYLSRETSDSDDDDDRMTVADVVEDHVRKMKRLEIQDDSQGKPARLPVVKAEKQPSCDNIYKPKHGLKIDLRKCVSEPRVDQVPSTSELSVSNFSSASDSGLNSGKTVANSHLQKTDKRRNVKDALYSIAHSKGITRSKTDSELKGAVEKVIIIGSNVFHSGSREGTYCKDVINSLEQESNTKLKSGTSSLPDLNQNHVDIKPVKSVRFSSLSLTGLSQESSPRSSGREVGKTAKLKRSGSTGSGETSKLQLSDLSSIYSRLPIHERKAS